MVLSSQKYEKENVRLESFLKELTSQELKLLDELSSKTKLSKEEIIQFLIFNSATTYRIAKLKEESPQFSTLLEEISTKVYNVGDYREIKPEYLSLIEKIRNPNNLKDFFY